MNWKQLSSLAIGLGAIAVGVFAKRNLPTVVGVSVLTVSLIVGGFFFYRSTSEEPFAFAAIDENWTYRFEIISSNVLTTGTIDACWYDLSNAPAGFWTNVKSDGGDIRVTRGDGTQIAAEVSNFSHGGQFGSVYFPCSDMSTSADTTYYIVYGNSAASQPAVGNTYGRNNVWTEFEIVWHFDEPANTTSGGYADSTGNGYDATGVNTTATTTGKIGTAQVLDGSTSYITFPTTGTIFNGLNDYTVLSWGNSSDLSAGNTIFHPRADYDMIIIFDSSTSYQAYWTGSEFFGAFAGFGGRSEDTWYNFASRAIGSDIINHSINGLTAASGNVDVSSSPPTTPFGINSIGHTSWCSCDWFDGAVEEYFILTKYVSDAYLVTMHNIWDDNAAFWDTGAQESLASDTCTPTAGTEWQVDLADDCWITDAIIHDAGLACYGIGSFTIASTGVVRVASSTCPVQVKGGGVFIQ